MTCTRAALAAFALVAASGIAATSAVAHSDLAASTPRAGATVAHLPRTLTATFDGTVLRVVSVRVLLAGRDKVVGTPVRAPRNARRVLTRVRGDAQGLYRVVWSIVGADGHTLSGTYRFRVRR